MEDTSARPDVGIPTTRVGKQSVETADIKAAQDNRKCERVDSAGAEGAEATLTKAISVLRMVLLSVAVCTTQRQELWHSRSGKRRGSHRAVTRQTCFAAITATRWSRVAFP